MNTHLLSYQSFTSKFFSKRCSSYSRRLLFINCTTRCPVTRHKFLTTHSNLTYPRSIATPQPKQPEQQPRQQQYAIDLVYAGPFTRAVKAVKTFSLTTSAIALVCNPILIYFSEVPHIVVTSLITGFALLTTGILHWFTKSYVTRLFYDYSSGTVTTETLTLFGRRKLTSFHISEARPPDSLSAISTFQGGGRHYFIHTEVFENSELLEQLLGSYAVFKRKC